MSRLVIGTRGSKLALAQTRWVADALRRVHPDLEIDIRSIQTRGDATQAANVPLASFGEKGIFAKELETALLAGEIDLAVHSLKDMAHTLPDGLTIAAVPPREDPRDCLLGSALDALPPGARVGTGSVRRRALLLSRRPDLQMLEIRGNIDTRLRKLQEGQYDAICLAVAGLSRLGLQEHVAEIFDPDWFTPDPGQGALALETRDSHRIPNLVKAINDETAELTTRAERAFLRAIGGSCKTPIGASATVGGNYGHYLWLDGMIAAPDGTTILRKRTVEATVAPQSEGLPVADYLRSVVDAMTAPEILGQQVAAQLRAAGAERLLGLEGGVASE
ncbi:MAG: hydroxymethylbilane synthase [Armatimonadetes bacterium]|nr:hydroxymethylbilane synthase [Armatimonadota bacterium]